jgi:hypothetical protein
MSLWQSFKRLPEQEQKRQFEVLARPGNPNSPSQRHMKPGTSVLLLGFCRQTQQFPPQPHQAGRA